MQIIVLLLLVLLPIELIACANNETKPDSIDSMEQSDENLTVVPENTTLVEKELPSIKRRANPLAYDNKENYEKSYGKDSYDEPSAKGYKGGVGIAKARRYNEEPYGKDSYEEQDTQEDYAYGGKQYGGANYEIGYEDTGKDANRGSYFNGAYGKYYNKGNYKEAYYAPGYGAKNYKGPYYIGGSVRPYYKPEYTRPRGGEAYEEPTQGQESGESYTGPNYYYDEYARNKYPSNKRPAPCSYNLY